VDLTRCEQSVGSMTISFYIGNSTCLCVLMPLFFHLHPLSHHLSSSFVTVLHFLPVVHCIIVSNVGLQMQRILVCIIGLGEVWQMQFRCFFPIQDHGEKGVFCSTEAFIKVWNSLEWLPSKPTHFTKLVPNNGSATCYGFHCTSLSSIS
jgi:hypothetical protein